MISRNLFTEFFAALLAWADKTDPNGLLEQAYWDQMQATEPSESEMWDAISAYIDSGRGWPNAQDLKRHIWDKRKRSQPQFKAAVDKVPPVKGSEFRVAIAAAIYAAQGDTQFYRNFLEGGRVMDVSLPGSGITITHEQVMAYEKQRKAPGF